MKRTWTRRLRIWTVLTATSGALKAIPVRYDLAAFQSPLPEVNE